MIKMERIDKMSIEIELDNNGLNELLMAFDNIIKSNLNTKVDIYFDDSIINMKKKKSEKTVINLKYINDYNTSLKKEANGGIDWLIGNEDLDCGYELLCECKKKDTFCQQNL